MRLRGLPQREPNALRRSSRPACSRAGLVAVMSADDPMARDAQCHSSESADGVLLSTAATHWVNPKHVRQRSLPFGHHKRAHIGDIVVACRRAAKSFHFLDAEVLDVAPRHSRPGEGLAEKRSGLAVQLAYPVSQMYEVVEENETPRMIARKFGLALADLLAVNAHLSQDGIQSHSKLRKGTEITLPPFPAEAMDGEAKLKAQDGEAACWRARSHWDLEYLVQYMHGGQACGAVEWIGPELVFETRAQRVLVAVPRRGAAETARRWPSKAQLVTSMLVLDAVTCDRWRFPKAPDALLCCGEGLVGDDGDDDGGEVGGGEDQGRAPRACLVVGMQDAAAYHRHLLPLSLGHLPACVAEQASAAAAAARGTPLSGTRTRRCTFARRASGHDQEADCASAPLWWSPLLDNVIPLEARWTMKGKDGGGRAVESWDAQEAPCGSLQVRAPRARPPAPRSFRGYPARRTYRSPPGASSASKLLPGLRRARKPLRAESR
jgi:hypothetical protein